MEDKNDNFGNFLRKRLNDLEASDGHWDKPVPALRHEVLNQIFASTKPVHNYRKIIWIAALCLTLISSFLYTWSLQNQIIHLKTSFKNQETQLQELNKNILHLEEKHQTEKRIFFSQKETLISLNQNLAQEKTQLNQLLQNQQSNIARIQQEQKNLLPRFNVFSAGLRESLLESLSFFSPRQSKGNLVLSLNAPYPTSKNSTKTKTHSEQITRIGTLQEMALLPLQAFSTPAAKIAYIKPSVIIIPIKSKQAQFEIGYTYQKQGLKMPLSFGLMDQKIEPDNIQTNLVQSNLHGINFAYSFKKNWWVRTGLRASWLKTSSAFDLDLYYDNSQEYLNQDGKLTNDFFVETNTPYSSNESTFNVIFDAGQGLDKGTFIKVNIEHFQSLKHFQIPLGLEYTLGNSSLQGLLQSGLVWNNMIFGDFYYKPTLKTKDSELYTDIKDKVFSKGTSSKQFFSSYAGVGLTYHLFKNWQSRAAFTYNYNFIDNKNTKFSPTSKINTAWEVGLNYQF